MAKRNRVLMVFILISVVVMSFFYLVHTNGNKKLESLKCKSFSTFEMEKGGDILSFTMVEIIQFYKKSKGLIQFEGYVKSGDQRTYLDRTVFLRDEVPDDFDNFIFSVEKVDRSKFDTTPDERFNKMWSELAVNDEMLNISIRAVRNNAYTVISPYAPQFTCAPY